MENRGRGNEPRFGPGPNFPRGPHGPGPRDSFKRGPQNNSEQSILGSPPRVPDGLRPEPEKWPLGAPPPLGGRMSILGSPPPFPGPPNARPGILGSHPGIDKDREPEPRRPVGDRDEHRESANFEMPGIQPSHPHDLSSRGFRRGIGKGILGTRPGNDPQRPHPQDMNDERNGENRGRGRGPFQRGGRGGPREAQGPDDNRRPWPPNSGPVDPRFRRPEEHDQPDRRPFDRQQPWDEPPENEPVHPHDFRGPPHMDANHGDFGPPPRDPRAGPHYGRGPPQDIDTRGPPEPPERRSSDDSQRPPENKPRPLMSLMSINPIIPPPGRTIEHDDPDRPPNQRKRSEEGEIDREREWDNMGPPQKMRFPHGPPEDRRDSRGERDRPFPDEPIGWRGRGGMR